MSETTSDSQLVHNPLMQYPRNAPCFCESGRKYKQCHGPLAVAWIPRSEAVKIAEELSAWIQTKIVK